MCSTNWATTAYFISGRMMGVEPMTKGATILYSTNWATISIFVPSKESNLHTYNVYHCIFYLEFIMIRYHQDANYRSVAVTNIRTKPAFCGRGGIRTHCVSYVLGLQPSAQPPSEQPSHYFVWMARLERALAITACSGPQNRRGLPTPPHPDYKFYKLVNDLKIKRASSLLRKLFISYIV